MEKATQKFVTITYDNDGTYAMIYIDLFFRRRTLFYSFNLITPGIIISILSIAGFILPAESGEKIGLRKKTETKLVTLLQIY